MNNFSANYGKILKTIPQVEKKMNFLNQIRKPRLSDIELIAIDLTSEYMGIDSEYQLFRVLPLYLQEKIERSIDGLFSDFELTKASVHDIHYLKDVKLTHSQCTILEDKGYLNAYYQLDLFESKQIK